MKSNQQTPRPQNPSPAESKRSQSGSTSRRERETAKQSQFKEQIKENNKFIQKIGELNKKAVHLIREEEHLSAVETLRQAEQLLEFAAENGLQIDSSLIIVVLYNLASAYQLLWKLDKCQKYIDAVIFNLSASIQADQQAILHLDQLLLSSKTSDLKDLQEQREDKNNFKMKKTKFLIRCQLQYCAILSQNNNNRKALEVGEQCHLTLRTLIQEQHSALKQRRKQQRQKVSKSTEISFCKIIIDRAYPTLKALSQMVAFDKTHVDQHSAVKMRKEGQQNVYFWRNNPELNEKQLRQELKIPTPQGKHSASRSLLGVTSRPTDWLESFNIGTMMHMTPLSLQEFQFYGEFLYEMAQRQLDHTIICLSILFFTLATETRFLYGKDPLPSQESAVSEAYHLKAIEIACTFINCKCPFISHLILNYQKNFNANLESIPEESIHELSQSLIAKRLPAQKNQLQLQIETKLQHTRSKCNDSPVLRPEGRQPIKIKFKNACKQKQGHPTYAQFVQGRKSTPTASTPKVIVTKNAHLSSSSKLNNFLSAADLTCKKAHSGSMNVHSDSNDSTFQKRPYDNYQKSAPKSETKLKNIFFQNFNKIVQNFQGQQTPRGGGNKGKPNSNSLQKAQSIFNFEPRKTTQSVHLEPEEFACEHKFLTFRQ